MSEINREHETLVLVDSGAEFGGEVSCAPAEDVRIFSGACGPLGYPLRIC